MSLGATAQLFWPASGNHVVPVDIPLDVRAQIRGAIWTARGPLPFGPRPEQPTNCVCIDYFECFTPDERQQIIELFGPQSSRRYTHAPMGPMVDPGYHGQLPATDWRENPAPYFSAAQEAEDAGIRIIHFLRPDRGCAGLEWAVDDLERELGPVFQSTVCQQLFGIVCLGWEPGTRYYYDNAWWVEMCQWMAATFPKALRLIHMVSDCDAPTGGDDYRHLTNGQCWQNVAPYIHGFLAQYGGYVGMAMDGIPYGSAAFNAGYAQFKINMPNAIADMKDRFITGRGGWPTFSAWGEHQPVRMYAGEYAAFADYWYDWPESESVELGRLAMQAGADGFLDGGTSGG